MKSHTSQDEWKLSTVPIFHSTCQDLIYLSRRVFYQHLRFKIYWFCANGGK